MMKDKKYCLELRVPYYRFLDMTLEEQHKIIHSEMARQLGAALTGNLSITIEEFPHVDVYAYKTEVYVLSEKELNRIVEDRVQKRLESN